MENYLYDAVSNCLIELPNSIFTCLEQGNFNNECEYFLYKNNCIRIRDPVEFNINYYHTDDELEWMISNRVSGLLLTLTEQCNLRCEYCGYMPKYKNATRKLNKMSQNIAFKAIDLLANNSHESTLLSLSFYGGEPLLNFNLIKECVEYWKEKYPFFRIPIFNVTTNAVLLGEEIIANYLIDNDFYLNISFDGPKEIQDKFRVDKFGCPSFDKVFENLVKFYKKDPNFFKTHVIFNSVITPATGNKRQYDYLSKLCKSNIALIDVSFTEYFLALLKQEKIETPFLFNPEQYPFVQESILKDVMKFHKSFSKREENLNIFPGGFCLPGVRRNFVTASGKIVVCEKVNEEEDSFCIGDVYHGLDVKKIRQLLDRTLEKTKKCKSCWAAKFCDLCFKDIFNLNEDFCKKRRNQVESDLVYYLEKVKPNKELTTYLENLSIS
jgi:uncharacterized protein